MDTAGSQVNRFSLTAVFETDPADVDIVFVHGLNGHPEHTWTSEKSKIFWPHQLLPPVLDNEKPRILVYGYDVDETSVTDGVGRDKIHNHAENFVAELAANRRRQNATERPIIFVAHSFGGLVVKRALIYSSEIRGSKTEHLRSIFISTYGILFLGTPHKGTDIAKWKTQHEQSCDAVIPGVIVDARRDLVDALKMNNEVLQNIDRQFVQIMSRFHIFFFHEGKPTKVGTALEFMVDEDSASPTVQDVERAGIQADHLHICQFENNNAPGFNIVTEGIQRYAGQAPRIITKRWEAEKLNRGWQKEEDIKEIEMFYAESRSAKETLQPNSQNSSSDWWTAALPALPQRIPTEKELECLQCLTSNYREDKDRNDKRVPGTCEWFFEHPIFLGWCQKDASSLLWVSADPGCGKSVLSRTLVDEGLLRHEIRNSSVCYFFFKDDNDSRQNGAQALCAILHQLFIEKPALLRHAIDGFRNNGKHLCTMFRELWDILNSCANDPEAGEIICILDALDECRQSARENLLLQLSYFYSAQDKGKTKLKFLVTSRPYYDIERSFHGLFNDMSHIRLKGEEESEKISKEIDLVIDYQVPRICNSRNSQLKPEVQIDLINHLKGIQHRTYLWLHLIFDVIRKCLDSTKVRLRKLISRLPSTVEAAYEKILMKINESERAEEAKKLLHIIVAAARPLALQEMNIALAISETLETGNTCQSFDELDLEPENSFHEKVRNLCGLFITIIGSKIYLIHQTAKEFLVSKNIASISMNPVSTCSKVWKHSLNPVESNLLLVKNCLFYLLFDELNRQVAEEKALEYDTTLFHGFLHYSANHWVTHYRQAEVEDDKYVLQSSLDVCDTRSNRFQTWFQIYSHRDPYGVPSRNFTTLIVTSYLGLKATVKLLLKQNSIELNHKDDRGRTAFSWAAQNRHAEVIKLLLEQINIELNLKDGRGRTPFLWAAYRGYADVVKLLLEQDKMELNLEDDNGRTALSWAAYNGHAEVVRLLLEHDNININIKDIGGQTAFSLAAFQGHVKVIKIFLDQGNIELNAPDNNGRTAFSWAANKGFTEVVRLLLEQKKIDINFKDNSGRTSLLLAAWNGHIDVFKLLLEQDTIEINSVDNDGRTAFSWAVRSRHTEIFRLLLEQQNLKINANDHRGRTLLSWAAENGFTEAVRFLLEQDKVDINPKDNNDRTALVLAAVCGHTDVVRLLLEQDKVDINIKDNHGRTALISAVCSMHTEIVKLLLEQDKVDIHLKDNDGRTALSLAAWNGNTDVVRLLLEQDKVDINLKDNDGRTALISAASWGRTEVVKLLLEQDKVDINIKDNDGRTALISAAWSGHTEVVRLLLEQSKADINLKDNNGRTALISAASCRRAEIVRLLLEQSKTDINLKDNGGRTALIWAADNGNTDVVRLLLEQDKVDINLKNNDGRTALISAVLSMHTEIVKLLLEQDKVDINLKDNDGRTALMWAAWNGNTHVVTLLLEQDKIDINLKDNDGRTALSLAESEGRKYNDSQFKHIYADTVRLLESRLASAD